jgi:hypothetical protein
MDVTGQALCSVFRNLPEESTVLIIPESPDVDEA